MVSKINEQGKNSQKIRCLSNIPNCRRWRILLKTCKGESDVCVTVNFPSPRGGDWSQAARCCRGPGQTSKPSERGSSGRAHMQNVNQRLVKWNSFGKRLGYCALLRSREQRRGVCGECKALSSLGADVLYIHQCITGAVTAGTLVLESADKQDFAAQGQLGALACMNCKQKRRAPKLPQAAASERRCTRFSLGSFAAFRISQHRRESLCQRQEHRLGCLAPDFML